MSKELEALKRLRECLEYGDDELGDVHYSEHIEDLDIIETTLKAHYEGLYNAKQYVKHSSSQALYDLLCLALKNVHKSFWKLPEQLYDDVNKSIKALEIIKEIIPIKENDFFYDKETDTYFFIGHKVSKEKYELLKDVLLCQH